jgi:enhancing lycopene biosynthesis protein 2
MLVILIRNGFPTYLGVPIALCCIAPILAAKVFGSSGVEITLGKKGDETKWPYGGALDAAKSFGAKVVEKNVDEVNLIIMSERFVFTIDAHKGPGRG